MATIMIAIVGGLFLSLIVFFICEEKSLKDANFSDMKCMMTEDIKVSECFDQFNTKKYLLIYFFTFVVIDLVLAILVFKPNAFGILEIMAYTFVTSLMGSGIILLVKWSFQPMIKLISSFLYGSVFMLASIISFTLAYTLM